MHRQTNNSVQAALFSGDAASGEEIPPPVSETPVSDGIPSRPSDLGAVASGSTAPAISSDLLAVITRTVQAAFAAEREKDRLAQTSSVPSSSVISSSGGVPAGLQSTAANMMALGNPLALCSEPSGMPYNNIAVPSFVTTFCAPHMSLATSCSNVESSLAAPLRGVGSSIPFAPSLLSPLDQPFVVGPGFSPVPGKLVAQIVAGKFIELSDLLSANLQLTEPEPQLLLDGRLVLTAQPKKQRRRIEDIASWLEAFTIYTLVTVSHFSHRWRDLTQYKLLILRTYRHFSGQVWLAYDRAFREHAAAIKLTDWSNINVQLFNFHAAGSSVRNQVAQSSGIKPEPTGSSSSLITCISWNKGRCTAPYAHCRFAHRCRLCSGEHRAQSCPSQSTRPTEESKRRASSPAPSSSSSAKSRRS